MSRPRLPAELRDLVDKVARHPHGLGFLHQSYLETVAVTLGVHPFVVDAARCYLDTPEGRAVLIEEVRRARESWEAGPGRPPGEREHMAEAARGPDTSAAGTNRPAPGPEEPAYSLEEPAPGPGKPPPGPAELIAAAERHPLGRGFILHGPPETVAITFRVHPFVVFRARGLLQHRAARAARDRS